ncbi:MAG: hypothetical protein HYY52_01045 [Candidatus Melainabacteria bacterium]|nr:hypothetical protein [Candidatus Melainabacteria bacterium]
MQTNGLLITKDRVKTIQKAIMAGIGAASSRELIQKAAKNIYSDAQKIAHNLFERLEEQGELKTQETKRLIKHLQKQSESEKKKIYIKLQHDCKKLISSIADTILTPFVFAKNASKSLRNSKPKTKKWKNIKKPKAKK